MISLKKLKIELMVNGVNIEKDALDYLKKRFGEKFYNDDYVTTTGIMLVLGNNFYVTSDLNKESIYKLTLINNNLILKFNNEEVKVEVWQPIRSYIKNKISKEESKLLSSPIAATHFDRTRISPIGGCNNHCAFCTLNNIKYTKNSIEDLDKCLQVHLKDDRVTHVLITGGSPKECDLKYLTEVYKFFCQKYPQYSFDVMMTPRGFDSYPDTSQYLEYLKLLKSFGVGGLSINLELYDKKICEKYCREKFNIGRENYFYFLKLASKVFGTQNVRSGIIIGLESLQSSLKGVEEICKCGAMPVLSPYVPYNNIGTKPSTKFLENVLTKSEKIVKNYNLNLAPGCPYCHHNTL